MHHFHYTDGILHAESVSIPTIAEAVGTPFYCYSTATFTRHVEVLSQAFDGSDHLICYAVKANSNQAVLKTMAALGTGMDVVSEGELRRARAAGVPPNKIIFAGVGKTRDEMAYAINEDILGFNVESAAELNALSEVASGLGKTARIAIRVNPDVDAKTHAKISTGKSENKFGVPYSQALALYDEAANLPGIDVTGIHMHIGSQITELEPFRLAFARMREFYQELRTRGHNISHLDIGGGLGVPYSGTNDIPPHPDEYAKVVRDTLGDLGLKFVMEPGRMIAANAGILVSSVIYTKPTENKHFTIIDAAMNDLIRPTLYDAHHDVWPVIERPKSADRVVQDLVGPVCESGDYLGQNQPLPLLEPDELIAFMSAGAYGAVMASTYNTRLLIPEVLVNGDQFAVVRPRTTYDELISLDKIPPWFT
ncbi:MAG: diaminopimelate decarboxylase [Hyphomicrobiaceae bacterium]|jgi:diaminopimelate decarboxylase